MAFTSNDTQWPRDRFTNFFKSHLTMLPTQYTQTETNRMTLAFFSLGALALLDELENSITHENKKDWIEWIYAQQLLPTNQEPNLNERHCGFRGSSWSGRPFDPSATTSDFYPNDSSHIANTYTALVNLLLLGDDLSRVNKSAIINTLRTLQQEDGSIAPTFGSLERDVRFIYCACCISYILNDWSGVDIAKTVNHIRQLQSYEYAFGQCPEQEAHGGSTFCGIASLSLMSKLDEGIIDKEELIKWCLERQTSGFQGRPNKKADICYGFWIGASLCLLDSFDLVNQDELRKFQSSCQPKMGGFGKDPESYSDLLHSYMGVAVLSIMNEPGMQPINPSLNIPSSVYEHLKKNSVFWKQ